MRHARIGLALAIGTLLSATAGADVGTIQYDSGILTTPGPFQGPTWGNEFASVQGQNPFIEPVLATGSITQIQAYIPFMGNGVARVDVFGPPSGTTAPVIASTYIGLGPGASSPGFTTLVLPTPIVHTGGTFLVGVWNRTSIPDYLMFDLSGTNLGQGWNGMRINRLGSVGTGLARFNPTTGTTAANAVLRVSGNLLPPEFVPALAISKNDTLQDDADTSGSASVGDTIRYTISIRNDEPGNLTGITFADTPDASTSLVVGSVTTSQGTVATGNTGGDTTVAVNVGTIGPGATATVGFDVVLNSVTTVSNQGSVAGVFNTPLRTDDPDLAGAADPTTTTVGVACSAVDAGAATKPKVKLKFNKPMKDSWSLKIKNMMLPGVTSAAGAMASVTFGGNAVVGDLDAKGKFKGVDESIKLKQSKSGLWKLAAKRKKRDMAGDFADEGLVDADNPKPGLAVQLLVNLSVDGVCFTEPVDLFYKSKLGKSGTAKP